MKRTFKSVLNAVMLTAVLSTTVLSCAKEAMPVDVAPKSKTDLPKLKGYMSKLIGVDVNDIKYNEENGMMSILGHDQISLKELTAYYEQSLKK